MTIDPEELKLMFADVTPPPSRLTSADAVRLGMADRRGRRLAVGGATSVLVVAVVGTAAWAGSNAGHSPTQSATKAATSSASPKPSTPPSAAAKACPATVLALPADYRNSFVGIEAADPTGDWIAGFGGMTGILWHNGRPATFPNAPGTNQPQSHGVNTKGEIVGATHTISNIHNVPFLYRNGTTVVLPMPAPFNQGGVASGINSAGDIVGTVDGPGDSDRAILWPAGDLNHPKLLSQPKGLDYGAEAVAINDDGIIVGNLDDGTHPFMWTASGVGHRLAETPGQPGGRASATAGDYAYGDVGGGSARWDLATGAMITVDTGSDGMTVAGNVHGDFVANFDFSTDEGAVDPVQIDGHSTVLATVAKGENYQAAGISNGRNVVGNTTATDGKQQYVPVIWHC
ncbi:MAG TPA: hypothetical protein VGJ28_10985 [Micromonosporaceae bacterium]|jgi:hypothetical protein